MLKNQMKKRISTEIMDSILRSTLSGTTATNMMFNGYLSHKQFKSYLALCLSRGFIRYEAETELYWITPNGAKFLESLDEVRIMIGKPQKITFDRPSIKERESPRPLLVLSVNNRRIRPRVDLP